jgi:hypothetical protein
MAGGLGLSVILSAKTHTYIPIGKNSVKVTVGPLNPVEAWTVPEPAGD